MTILVAFGLVTGIFLAGVLGAAAGGRWAVGVALPYAAAAVFVAGLTARVLRWARSPVPFRITTTCGQQRALAWIPNQRLENPHSRWAVLGRMALEVLTFRSLLRNTKTVFVDHRRLVYATDLSLWLGAMVLHWSLLIILLRHLRLVLVPVPGVVLFIERVDGFLEIGMPVLYVTSFAFLAAAGYLLLRRLVIPTVRYVSLVGDYVPLFLLLAIAGSGIWPRPTSPASRPWRSAWYSWRLPRRPRSHRCSSATWPWCRRCWPTSRSANWCTRRACFSVPRATWPTRTAPCAT